jgi:aminoglycoside phosphotransferase family enzyme/predicted kinase
MTSPEAEQKQEAVIRFLSNPATYGLGKRGDRDQVEHITTHAAHVFLAGDRVWKLKRAVTYGFLDFSTLELRHKAVLRELALNRRTAPDIYLEVTPITKSGSHYELGGKGKVEDWLLVMRRFDQADIFDRMALDGRLTPEIIRSLGDDIATFHQKIEPVLTKGGAARMQKSISDVFEALEPCVGDMFNRADVDHARARIMAELDRIAPGLDLRRDGGFVRFCHGDMHLANICLWQGKATPFDCIEFNDDIATCDLLHDLAFPVMDLVFFNLVPRANLLINRYFEATRDYGGLTVFNFFLAARACIRAMATGLAAKGNAAADRAAPRRYLDLVSTFLAQKQPRLVAVGGLSGSGKSALARSLACEIATGPGAIILRSDGIRKRLLGHLPEEKLPASAYTPEVNKKVYERLQQDTLTALKAGYSVIADAAHLREGERDAVANLAKSAGVPFCGLWLDIAPEAARARLNARVGDASDANVAVYDRQLAYQLGDIKWPHLDAGQTIAHTLKQALAIASH